MARGFGATLGVGTTDLIQRTGLTFPSTLFTLSCWILRNGAGGGGFGRAVLLNDAADVGARLAFNGTDYAFARPAATTAGNYTFTGLVASVWHHIVIAWDNSSVATPTTYVNGLPFALFVNTALVTLFFVLVFSF